MQSAGSGMRRDLVFLGEVHAAFRAFAGAVLNHVGMHGTIVSFGGSGRL